MSTEGNKMGTSPAASAASAEAGSSTRDSVTSASGGAPTQPDLILVQEASQRLRMITSINDNSDIETSAAIIKAESEAESAASPGSQYADAQTGVTPIRRIDDGVQSDPIEIPDRNNGNGIDHAATSPTRGTADAVTPIRPLNMGRLQLGPDTTLMATPVGHPRTTSPIFRRLMSPGTFTDRSLTVNETRPSVSPMTAGPVASPASGDGDGYDSLFEGDTPNFRSSSVLSGRGSGECVVQITSPTDGVTLPVTFPENSTGASLDRETSTIYSPRGPRTTRAAATHRPHNLRDTATISSSATSLMPRSSHGSTESSDHEGQGQGQAQAQDQEQDQDQEQSQDQNQAQAQAQGRYARVRGPGTVSYGPRRPAPRIMIHEVSKA
ncbi:hypothetical protein F5Y02DRAFT_377529 [Annulohypoxylon stygium]|nr:hypothetical protein F5Y02DRAFT_377529 [Annulohypoxylon stygium]